MYRTRFLTVALVALATATLVAAAGCAQQPTTSSREQQETTRSAPSSATTTPSTATPAKPESATPTPPKFPGASAFTNPKENAYFPLNVGRTWTYTGTDNGEPVRDVVTISSETTQILGVTCVVAEDKVYASGVLQEHTFDWYAKANDGTVWYMGEDTKELDENGKVVSTEGSWKSGVDGAKPGIIMEAQPKVGDTYLQEYLPDVALDLAQVVDVSASVTVPTGSYDNALRTSEWTPLEPKVLDQKYYAHGIGQVREQTVKGGQEDLSLESYK